jgi:hypothetical protein
MLRDGNGFEVVIRHDFSRVFEHEGGGAHRPFGSSNRVFQEFTASFKILAFRRKNGLVELVHELRERFEPSDTP